MIMVILTIVCAGIAGGLLPYLTIDECKGKQKSLLILSSAFSLLIASIIFLISADVLITFIGAASGVILTYALRKKHKHDLIMALLGLGYGLTNNLLIASLIILHNIPHLSLISLEILVKKRDWIKALKKISLPLASFVILAFLSSQLITVHKEMGVGFASGGLMLISICNLLKVKK